MKITENNLFTVLEADEGYILVDKLSGYGAYVIYLGKFDSIDNYKEILESEYVEPIDEE